MKLLTALLLAAVGVIHLVPVSGLLGNDALARLYGVTITTPDLEILMRHRAVLFGIVGGLLVAAAFMHRLQPVAILAGLMSIASFLWIAWTVGDYGSAIAGVVRVDIVALVALIAAAALRMYTNMPGQAH